jgi:cytochrome c peroxidase
MIASRPQFRPIPQLTGFLWALALICLTSCDRCQDPGCVGADCNPEATPYLLEIPPFFPPMDIPADNLLTVEGVHLGHLLFWEKSLSEDGSISCGSCHLPEHGFSDPSPYSTGITGAQGIRNAMAIINIGWASSYFWDGRAATLEEQILEPVAHPDEMALPWPQAVARLQANSEAPGYPQLFLEAFGTTTITAELTSKAIAQFLRTLISADSKFDQWRRGETTLSDDEFAGYEIFLREGGDPETTPGGQFGGDCFHCHGEAGLQFSDYLFRNNGLDGSFGADAGRAGVTGMPLDSGRFKTPTLRNITLTAPYMHDGRFITLEEVLDHYNSGGVPSTTIDPFMKYTTGGLALNPVQKTQLLAFLETLTDTSFIAASQFQDPH